MPEIGTFTAVRPPIVVLTSNRSRDLHDALRRRCLYHWLEYPGAGARGGDPAPHGALGRRWRSSSPPRSSSGHVRGPSTWTSHPVWPRRSTGWRRCRRWAPPSWSATRSWLRLGARGQDAGRPRRRASRRSTPTRSAERGHRAGCPCWAAWTAPPSSAASAAGCARAGVPVTLTRDDGLRRGAGRRAARSAVRRSTGWRGSPWSAGSRTSSRVRRGSSTPSSRTRSSPVDRHARRQARACARGDRTTRCPRSAARPASGRGCRRPAVAHPAAHVGGGRRRRPAIACFPSCCRARWRGSPTRRSTSSTRHELAVLGRWLEESAHRWPTRRSRRLRVRAHGRSGGAARDDRRVPAYRLGADGAQALPPRAPAR